MNGDAENCDPRFGCDETCAVPLAEALPGILRNPVGKASRPLSEVIAALMPVVDAIADKRAAETLNLAIRRVQVVYDLQCPVMPPDRYVGGGAYSAHLWWQKVLGGALDDLRALADDLRGAP